jgi:hypothetical protein
VLVAEAEAGALQEDRGDLLFTISVENIESSLYRALSTLEKKEGRGPLPSPSPDPHREGTEYRLPSSSLLRVITTGRRGTPVSRSLVGVLLVLGRIFGRR